MPLTFIILCFGVLVLCWAVPRLSPEGRKSRSPDPAKPKVEQATHVESSLTGLDQHGIPLPGSETRIPTPNPERAGRPDGEVEAPKLNTSTTKRTAEEAQPRVPEHLREHDLHQSQNNDFEAQARPNSDGIRGKDDKPRPEKFPPVGDGSIPFEAFSAAIAAFEVANDHAIDIKDSRGTQDSDTQSPSDEVLHGIVVERALDALRLIKPWLQDERLAAESELKFEDLRAACKRMETRVANIGLAFPSLKRR